MATSQTREFLQQLHRTERLRDRAGLTDGQLLEHYLSRQDEAALAEVVRRHGPMVWGVCCRVLGNGHDAEDAFQATFLVLVRKAASIASRELLANWLYGVANQTARKARATIAKRQTRERTVTNLPEPVVAEQDHSHDLLPLLDQELSRLPDKYRVVIVLCDLEGKTRKEAARQLGVPEGTVASRMATGRTMLAKRLARRGLGVSGVAMLLSRNVASASVPTAVLASTIQAVTLLAAGQSGAIALPVAALTNGVVKAMLLTKLKCGVLVLLGVLFLTVGAGLLTARTGRPTQTEARNKPDVNPAERSQPRDTDEKPTRIAGRLVHSLPGHKERLTSVAYAPDGRWIATAAWDGTARVWDAKTGKEVRRLDVPATKHFNPARLFRISFSSDNECIAAVLGSMPDESVIVWNRSTGEKVRQLPGGGCIAFAPDGKHFACGVREGNTGVINLYELATGKVVREMRGHQSRIDLLTFSPDGKTLFSQVRIPRPPPDMGVRPLGRDGAQVRVWDVATGKQRQTGLEEAWNEHHITLAPDGRTIAVTGLAGSNSISLREIATSGRRAELTGHTKDICEVAFSPDGRTLASASMDNTVRLWDLPSGKEIGRLEGHRHWVLSVAFSPDGGTLVSGGLDETALVWDVSNITGRRGESADRSVAELEADWKDLGGDAAKGYATLSRWISSPKRTVPFLGKQLQLAKKEDVSRIKLLIGKLDDGRFQVREQAKTELEALGDIAAPLLQKALAGNLSLERRRRLEALLNGLDGPLTSAEMIREMRAVEVLELIGNLEARRLLETLSAGPPERRLTQEAKASAGRLTRRREVGP